MSAGIKFQEEVGSDKRRKPFWLSNLFAHAGHFNNVQFASCRIPEAQLEHINSTIPDIHSSLRRHAVRTRLTLCNSP